MERRCYLTPGKALTKNKLRTDVPLATVVIAGANENASNQLQRTAANERPSTVSISTVQSCQGFETVGCKQQNVGEKERYGIAGKSSIFLGVASKSFPV